MPRKRNSAHNDIQLLRQERVARLRARGLTLRDIHTRLSNPESALYIANPDTGQPFDMATIQRDLARIRKRAAEQAQQTFEEYLAQQLAEIAEAKRAAWATKQLGVVVRLLELEAKLTGTLRPQMVHRVDDDQLAQLGEMRDVLIGKLMMLSAHNE